MGNRLSLLLVAATLGACGGDKAPTGSAHSARPPSGASLTENPPADRPQAPAEPSPSITVTFAKDRIYEIAALWVRPGHEAELGRYFEQAIPIAMKHGAKPLVGFSRTITPVGDFSPTTVGLAEWPSLEAFDEFLGDPEAKKLFPQRDAALDRMIVTHYRIGQEASAELDREHVYELAALWVKAGKQDQLDTYFQDAMPIAMSFGARVLAQLIPVRASAGDFMPSAVGLVSWPDEASFSRFVQDRAATQLFPKRDDALERMIVVHLGLQVRP